MTLSDKNLKSLCGCGWCRGTTPQPLNCQFEMYKKIRDAALREGEFRGLGVKEKEAREQGYRTAQEEWREWFGWIDIRGCMTGDCPHEEQWQCTEALRQRVDELERALRDITQIGRDVPAWIRKRANTVLIGQNSYDQNEGDDNG